MLSAHVQHIVFASHFSYCIYAQKAVPLQAFSLRGTFHPSRLFYPFRPFPSPLSCSCQFWQVFRLLSRPRRFAGSPRNLDFWGAFPTEPPRLCSDLVAFPPSSEQPTRDLDGRQLRQYCAAINVPAALKRIINR